MLGEVIFNFKKYKYRMEDKNKLLLYNPRNSGIFLVSGVTCQKLCNIIASNGFVQVDTDDKYISYFLKKEILMRRDA